MQQSSHTYPKQSDYPSWHYQPLRLLKQEMEHPLEVIEAFFSGYTLPQARRHFREMLEDAVCNADACSINYLTFYNDVEKLIEAAWLILGVDKGKENQPTVKATGDERLIAILRLLIAAIRPERIFLLSGSGKEIVDLLIVVPDRDAKPFRYYETIVSTVCYTIPDLSFSLHAVSSVQEALTAGSPFYLFSCTAGKEVYTAPGATPLTFPSPGNEKTAARQNELKIMQQRANAFFEAAKTCFESGSLTTAIFLLHQAAELSLYGLICTLWGREIKEHSLSVLYRHIRRLHDAGLNRLLSPATEEEKERLALLDTAYLKSRYSPSFQTGREQVTHITKWVLDLMDACHEATRSLLSVITVGSEG